MRHVDVDASETGKPVLPMKTRDPVPAGKPVEYRIPLVANARRFRRGHRIRLILTSDDNREDFRPMRLFSHAPVGIAGVNTVHSSSRLEAE